MSPTSDEVPTPTAARLSPQRFSAEELLQDDEMNTSHGSTSASAVVEMYLQEHTPRLMNEDHDIEEGSIMIQAPPPAYGRWRGSVRVEPDFLNWRPISLQELKDQIGSGDDDVKVAVPPN